jgi:nitrate/nitrite-specific signal transduction histidine kinase
MALCSSIKADGGRCRGQAISGSQWCLSHHPDYEEARRRRSSKGGKRGGRGRPQVEIFSIKQQLQSLADGVLDGSVERADGAVASQILNVLLRAITVELQVKEQQEHEERIAVLEEALRAQKDGNRWGA